MDSTEQILRIVRVEKSEWARLGRWSRVANVRGRRGGFDDDARIEKARGVKDPLDLTKEVDGVLRVHVLEKLASSATVAVLPRDGSPVGGDEPSRVAEKLPIALPACVLVEIEVDPDVDTSVPEVSVRHPMEAIAGQERLELGEVGGETAGRHRRVLPPGVRGPPTRRSRHQTGPVLANLPQGRVLCR
jgi:hypothetical protein